MKHIVGFSGGADSQACAGWVLDRFPKEDVILVNSDAGGNEHPMTTEHILWYSANVHPVVMLSPIVADMGTRAKAKIAELGLQPTDPLDFGTLAKIKGYFPSSQHQFCTEHLKLMPQRRWMNEVFPVVPGEIRVHLCERYAGVRRDESEARKDALEREWDDFFLCWLNRPLIRWTKEGCFDFLKTRSERINPLYTLGFDRVGCAPCVNSNKDDIRMWAARFPEMIDKVREWERRTGYTFFKVLVSRKRRYGTIDEVVEWAKTVHGGKQYALPILEGEVMSGVCMSNYGLCE